MSKNKKLLYTIISSVVVVVIALGVMLGYRAYLNSQVQKGTKEITIKVINVGDVVVKEIKVKTNEEFLRPVLLDSLTYEEQSYEDFITKEEKHYVTSIEGITPDSNHFWYLLVNDQESTLGIDDYPIKDNDVIVFKMTEISNYGS